MHVRCSHGHKNVVLCVKWNQNGNWVLTASKDQIIKVGNLSFFGLAFSRLEEMLEFYGQHCYGPSSFFYVAL